MQAIDRIQNQKIISLFLGASASALLLDEKARAALRAPGALLLSLQIR